MENATFAEILLGLFRTVGMAMKEKGKTKPSWPESVPKITNISVEGDHMTVHYKDDRMYMASVEDLVWGAAAGRDLEDVMFGSNYSRQPFHIKEQIMYWLSATIFSFDNKVIDGKISWDF